MFRVLRFKTSLKELNIYQKRFLLAKISIKVVFSISFSIFDKVDIKFTDKKLIWKTYTAKKILLTVCQINFINKKELAKNTLDKNANAFVIYVALLTLMIIYLLQKIQIVLLLIEKITVLNKDFNYANIFSEKLAEVLIKHTKIN